METNLTHAEKTSEELVEACLAPIVSDTGGRAVVYELYGLTENEIKIVEEK